MKPAQVNAWRQGELFFFLESLGTKPLRFLDLNVDHWRKLHRQAQKYLESSGLKEQCTQLYQWQPAAASRVFSSLSFLAFKRRTREGSEGSSTLASMSSICKGPSLNLESCPSRFAWATLCQDESEDFFQQSGRSQELALAGRARLLFTGRFLVYALPHSGRGDQVGLWPRGC